MAASLQPSYAVALFDYNATKGFTKGGLTDISIKKGDILLLVDEDNSSAWVLAKTQDGSIGYLPQTYIKRVNSLPTQVQQPGTNIGDILVARYDYNATGMCSSSGATGTRLCSALSF
jgi:hypothetical protein